MSSGLSAFTIFHVAISLIAIIAGFVVLYGFLTSNRLDRWTALFFISTAATSITGFLFPIHKFTPAIGVGLISLAILAIAIYARYPRRMAGNWRWVYVVAAMLAFYLNFFVLIVQSFMKIAPLHALAPTQTETPFKLVQLAALIGFAILTIAAAVKFRVQGSAVAA